MATTQRTLGQIALETPAAATVFEQYGLDYCCGGNRSLEDACREKGLPAAAVSAALEAAVAGGGTARDWQSASLTELIAHIVSTHHQYLKTQLPALTARAKKVVDVHGANHPELESVAQVFQGLREELEPHMYKEEAILFPYIEQLEAARSQHRQAPVPPFGSVENPIRMMLAEHDSAGRALAELRRLSGGYALPGDACTTYRALYYELQHLEEDLHRHIHLENNLLFPRATALAPR